MILRFDHKHALTVVGLATQFTMENTAIHMLWDEFNLKANLVKNAIKDAALGVCFYDPIYKKDKPFTYLAGRIVTRAEDIPAGWTTREIPECDYAVFEHKSALNILHKTYDYIYREWLPASEHEVAEHDNFEWYDERFKYGRADSIIEIWISIQK